MAVSFNGSTDVTDMGSALNVDPPNNSPIALVCWVNFASLGAFIQQLASRGFDGTNTGYMFQFDGTGGSPTFTWGSFNTGSGIHGVSIANSLLGLTTSTWYQFYGDYTGSSGSPASTWRFSLSGGAFNTNADVVGPIQISGRNFTVGAVNTGVSAYAQFLNACIADVAVFAGPLSSGERTGLANGSVRPNSGMSQTLLGYWKFDTVGSSQSDFSGNGQTGTYPQTTPTLCGSSPPFTSGTIIPIVGGASSFGIVKQTTMIGT